MIVAGDDQSLDTGGEPGLDRKDEREDQGIDMAESGARGKKPNKIYITVV